MSSSYICGYLVDFCVYFVFVKVRAITLDDFVKALSCIKASVSDKDLHMYEEWNKKFGISSR